MLRHRQQIRCAKCHRLSLYFKLSINLLYLNVHVLKVFYEQINYYYYYYYYIRATKLSELLRAA